jgi:hypothetical protein
MKKIKIPTIPRALPLISKIQPAGCEAATDEDGNACQWCNLAGMADV